jgi:hypothetical protein
MMHDLSLLLRRSSLVMIALCLIVCLARPGPAWAGTAVPEDVVSGGGGKSEGGGYTIHDTFAQGPIGPVATGGGIDLYDGFWGAVGSAEAVPADTVPPSSVVSFTAMPLDTSIDLEWTNPSDADLAGALIRYSTVAYPATPTDGDAVENGVSGRFYGLPDSTYSYTHGGLTNGTTYYYTAFAFDNSVNHATGLSDSATPYDGVPPAAVVSLSAETGDGQLILRWTNPSDPDLDHTLIRYSSTAYPTGPGDGTAVENGSEGRFSASTDSFVHTGLTNDIMYYYSAFAGDEVPNYAPAKQASGTPSDIFPPLPVTIFTATPQTDGSVELQWTTPDDRDFAGVVLRYSTSTYPTTPTSGSPVGDGTFTGDPLTVYDFTHKGLMSDVAHYYSVFTYDEVPNYSAAANAEATPHDEVPPELAISVFQNPYITNHLDIYVVATEPLFDDSVFCQAADDTLEMDVVDGGENVWRGDYDLCCEGAVAIHAEALDVNSLPGDADRIFTSTLVLASSGGLAGSVDGRCIVSIRGNTIARDTYVLIFEDEADVAPTGTVYKISPPGLELEGFAEIAIAYPDTTSEPQYLSIARLGEKGMTPVESYIDPETGRVIAYVDRFGSYGLLLRPDVVTPTYGGGDFVVLQNIPNPFAGTTVIAFEVPGAGQVRADVISIEGRLVRDLFDGYVIPGRHRIEWDGCDSGGRKVASGVYFYRVGYASKTITKKMIHLR